MVFTKNDKRKIISSVLAVFMCFSTIMPITTIPAEAKAAPKLSAKSVTIAKGGKQTIKLKNGKGTWTIKGNGVAKIKSKSKTSVTLTPLKAGKTTLTCKVGKKKLNCNIKVLNNKIGGVEDMYYPAIIVGKSLTKSYTLPEGVSYKDNSYNKKIGKLTVKTKPNADTGETKVTLTVKALKPGRFSFDIYYLNEGNLEKETVKFVFINGFRGKSKAKKTDKNYNAWRRKTISTMVKADMSTWEIINAIGCLISSGKYSSKGGATGKQLWYGGNGTCVSGAKMMDDFMKDIGISSKIHFMGNKFGAVDIYGYNIMYMSQHKNTWVSLGGKRYELNPQPGWMWPMGTVKR